MDIPGDATSEDKEADLATWTQWVCAWTFVAVLTGLTAALGWFLLGLYSNVLFAESSWMMVLSVVYIVFYKGAPARLPSCPPALPPRRAPVPQKG